MHFFEISNVGESESLFIFPSAELTGDSNCETSQEAMLSPSLYMYVEGEAVRRQVWYSEGHILLRDVHSLISDHFVVERKYFLPIHLIKVLARYFYVVCAAFNQWEVNVPPSIFYHLLYMPKKSINWSILRCQFSTSKLYISCAYQQLLFTEPRKKCPQSNPS